MNHASYVSIREEFRDPYIQNVAAMSLTELGYEAEHIDKQMHSTFRKGNSAANAALLIQAMYLRISRNLLSVTNKSELKDEAKKHNIGASGMDEYYFLETTLAAINIFIKHQSGQPNVNEFMRQHGFMATVMALTEIGNEMLKAMQDTKQD